MAMYAAIRRAAASALPLVVHRVVTSSPPRTFHSVLSVRLLLNSEIAPSVVPPSLRFANSFATRTSADDNLIQLLESEINCALEEHHAQNQVEIPFEVEDNPGDFSFQLKRRYNDETIKVRFDLHNIIEESDKKHLHPSFILARRFALVVSVYKGNGVCLEFGVTANPDEVSIDSLSMKQPEESDQLAYVEPGFASLDENVIKAFHKYLEIRGIKPPVGNFFHAYRNSKADKAYVACLKDLKNFIEK